MAAGDSRMCAGPVESSSCHENGVSIKGNSNTTHRRTEGRNRTERNSQFSWLLTTTVITRDKTNIVNFPLYSASQGKLI